MTWLDETSPEERTWTTESVDRTMAQYTVLIRSKSDPERSPRAKIGTTKSDPMAFWRKNLLTDDPAVWSERILNHLGDGVPRTFNRISVELLDKTADVVMQTPIEEGLWALVQSGAVEHTMEAPILFRYVPSVECGACGFPQRGRESCRQCGRELGGER